MSQHSDFQCRWKWCRDTYDSQNELLVHVRKHVRETEPCSLRDVSLHIRAEEGLGESLSGMTVIYGSSNPIANPEPNSSSLPSPPASSPIPNGRPEARSRSLQITPERAAKRRRVPVPPDNLSSSRFNFAQPLPHISPPQDLNHTPSFSALALQPEPEPVILNPVFPEFNTLLERLLARKPINVPNGSSQSFSGSDYSVERHLTQSTDLDFDTNFTDVANVDAVQRASGLDHLENVYAGELAWDDEATQERPGSRSRTPSHSSQSQSQSQSQLQSQPPMPAQISPRFLAPLRPYRSGSLIIHSPGGTASQSNNSNSESFSQAASFIFQTQAPYQSQSISQ
ncbi:hypothetical protein B0H15DRAFT_129960 [Mycena belliarum]|uniref:C2H2-type domain-containing protein n=1 Tax=Mycena belliarum TaxID=1033014 RepID=A0AAD6U8Y0_9AGAR|nr:hypothetical protein B0H15DRAFT_129960 [Mycena belliae]